jgi:hypothetical protein
MNARQLVFILRAQPNLDPVECLLYCANHVHEFRLRDGQRLNDATDFTTFLLELVDAVKPVRLGLQIDLTCPRCGHVHEAASQCGKDMGGAGICRCELEVPA